MNSGPQQVDVGKVIRTKIPGKAKYLPGFVVRLVEKIICQRRLNEILEAIYPEEGVKAANIAMREMRINVVVEGEENIPADGRFIFVSNHPLGGLDGLALISYLGGRYDGNIRFIVNDLLMAVEPLRSIFLPVNKYGAQRRSVVEEIEAQYAGDNQMITFPAGLCSRRTDSGRIHDLEWKKFVVTHAVRHHRDVIPIFFDEVNSDLFYFLARLRERLGFKFNAEMIMLPREMIRREGDTLHFHIGRPIPWNTLDEKNARAETERICEITYSLGRKSK